MKVKFSIYGVNFLYIRLMITRLKEKEILDYLRYFPAVGIVGPRQCGKSTVAKLIVKRKKNALYLDLENPEDRAKLTDPSLFLSQHKGKLICMDEVQFLPEIFSVLRGIIDVNKKNGQFLLLGSATPHLLRQSSETLAGRISYIELSPFLLNELPENKKSGFYKLWIRGGFPRSYLAPKAEISMVWRKNFIRTFLERDLSNLGIGIAPEGMRKFWMMCAHLHGQMLNLSNLGHSLGLSHTTIKNYVDVMVGTFMIVKLEPYYTNIDKRLKKTPKMYLTDTGLLHALLNINSLDELLAHPVAGFSWEGFVLIQLMKSLSGWEFYYASTADQAEIDFILKKGKHLIAVESKLSKSPTVTRGFYSLLHDLKIKEAYVASPIEDSYPISENTIAININALIKKLSAYK